MRTTLRLTLLSGFAVLSAISLAQITYYPNLDAPTYLNKFSVGSDGTAYFSNAQLTKVFGLGVPSTISFSVQGVSADGTVFGGRMAGMGSVGGYLDSTGSSVDFSYTPNDFRALFHEGAYTVSEVGQFYFGDTEIGYRSNVLRLNSHGTVLSGDENNASIVTASGFSTNLTTFDGIYSDRQAWDLTSSGRVLLSKTVDTPVNAISSIREFAFATYDAATGDLVDLPNLPQAFNQSSSEGRRVMASTNDSGDIAAAVITSFHGGNDAEIWHYNTILGWTNITQSLGIPAIASLNSIEITNQGVIYGTYQGRFSQTPPPLKGFTLAAPVPEPTSLILLALGAGGLIAARRRK